MQPTDQDFDKLLVPVHKITEDNIFDAVPVLKLYDEFILELPPDVSRAAVIKYIGVMYQKNSPFLEIESLARRKVTAANWAGFTRNKSGDKFIKPYMKILEGRDESAARMIVRMCRIQKSTEFQQLRIYETVLANEMESLLRRTDPKVIKETKGNIDSFTTAIAELTEQFFFGDNADSLKEELLDEIENETLEFSPEDIAQKRRNREQLINYNPYGDYVPEQITAIDEEKAGS